MRRPQLTPAELDRIADLREAGRSIAAIAVEVGCCRGSVAWGLLKLGVDLHEDAPLAPVPASPAIYHRDGREVRRFTAAEDARLLAMAAAGMRTYHIAKALGRQNNSVLGRLRSLARRDARAERQVA